MEQIKLVQKLEDMGWPDEGHYEWYMVREYPRKHKFLQRLFGPKEENILCYGERKPSHDEFYEDMKSYLNNK